MLRDCSHVSCSHRCCVDLCNKQRACAKYKRCFDHKQLVDDYKWVLRRQFQVPLDDFPFQEILFGAILWKEWTDAAPQRAAQAALEAERLAHEEYVLALLVSRLQQEA